MDEPPKGGRFRVRLDPESAERLRRATESTEDRVRSAMAEALRREEERIFGEIFGRRPAGSGSTYSSGKAGATPWDDPEVRSAFEKTTRARDFGRWSDKVSEPIWTGIDPGAEGGSWSHFDFTSQSFTDYETAARNADAAEIYGGTPCQAFATPTRSVFGTGPYLAVSEEPEVAVAAAQLREAREEDRRAFWKVGSDGMRVYHFPPPDLAGAEAKLKRRILAANRRRETQP